MNVGRGPVEWREEEEEEEGCGEGRKEKGDENVCVCVCTCVRMCMILSKDEFNQYKYLKKNHNIV